MAERKQTPDILAEIMSGAPSEAPQPVRAAAKTPPRAKKAAAPATTRAPRAPKGRWEYQVASFQHYHGCRLRYVDGVETAHWERAPLLHDVDRLALQAFEARGQRRSPDGFPDPPWVQHRVVHGSLPGSILGVAGRGLRRRVLPWRSLRDPATGARSCLTARS